MEKRREPPEELARLGIVINQPRQAKIKWIKNKKKRTEDPSDLRSSADTLRRS